MRAIRPRAIINNDLARIYFSNEDPIDKPVTFDDGESWISISVIGDVKHWVWIPAPSRSLLSLSPGAGAINEPGSPHRIGPFESGGCGEESDSNDR